MSDIDEDSSSSYSSDLSFLGSLSEYGYEYEIDLKVDGFFYNGEELLYHCRKPNPDLSRIRDILIEQPEVVHYRDTNNAHPLHLVASTSRATEEIDIELIKLLMFRGDIVDGNCCVSSCQEIRAMLHNGAHSPLYMMVYNNKLHLLKFLAKTNPPLLKKGDIQDLNLIEAALRSDTGGVEKLRFLLEQEPEAALTFHLGGELPIQTIHSEYRMPGSDREKYQIKCYRELIETGIAQESHKVKRAGLFEINASGSCPIQDLIQITDIDTLQYLVSCDPPLLTRKDVLGYFLMQETVRGANVDAFRFVLSLNAGAIDDFVDDFVDDCLPMINDPHHYDVPQLVEIIVTFVEAGLDQDLGGEFGVGGFLLPIEREDGTFKTILEDLMEHWKPEHLLPAVFQHLEGILIAHETPILQALIMTLRGGMIRSSVPNKYVQIFVTCCKRLISFRDSFGRLPLHVAIERKLSWKDGLVHFINADPSSASNIDFNYSGLYPFAFAAADKAYDLDACYELLRTDPSLIAP